MTGLLLACFVENSLKIDVSFSSTKRSVQRNVKFGGSKAKAKLLSRLSHKVCRRLSSPVLLRKFTTKQRRRRRQQEREKTKGLDQQNNNFARAARFFFTFLSRRYTTAS